MSKRLMLAVLFVVGLLVMTPSEASAQYGCALEGYTWNLTIPGSVRTEGQTVLNNCVYQRVQVWIDAGNDGCLGGLGIWGAPTYIGCYDEDQYQQKSSVRAAVYKDGCGSTIIRAESIWRAWLWDEAFAYSGEPANAGNCETEQDCLINGGYWYSGQCEGANSPIIIATGKDQSYRLTSAADGVLFDLDNDGAKELLSWTRADSDVAFLAIDRNGNGTIDNGSELLGNHTVPGKLNGFEALAQLQLEATGSVQGEVTQGHALYEKLLLWTDRNHNGVSEASELRPFKEQYSTIGLFYERHQRRDGFGNRFAYKGYVKERTKPGKNPTESPEDSAKRHRFIFDVFFVN